MESGYFITGIRTDKLVKLVIKNGISINNQCITRFLFLFYCSLLTSAFSIIERLKYNRKLKSLNCPEDPIIIVGHWRSGTTLLHQLLNQSPDLTAPSLFQVGTPDCFLSGKKILIPHIRPFLSKKRTVDNVRVSLNEPQEDEYAIFRMTGLSPVERLIFPKNSQYFLNNFNSFLPSYNDEPVWRDAFITFCKKLFLKSGKRIVLKNPFHSMRIPYLKQLLPHAKFIHIHRDPINTIPSSIRMWDIVGRQNSLIQKSVTPSMKDVIDMYDTMLFKIQCDFSHLNTNDYMEVAFEELESHPSETIKKICKKMTIPFSNTYKERIGKFINKTGIYKKNTYTLTEAQKKYIQNKLYHHMLYYGYK